MSIRTARITLYSVAVILAVVLCVVRAHQHDLARMAISFLLLAITLRSLLGYLAAPSKETE